MKKNISFILILFIIAGFSSCYYDAGDIIYPGAGGNCDTTAAVSYNQKVVPIFQQQCYSCHSAASPGGGIVMGTYATDKALVLNGKLYGSIAHTSGLSPMPKGAAKMNICSILSIKKWINSGSPDN